jgi:hypothetical protein
MVIAALRGPNWLGVNITFKVQFAPAAMLDPQVLFWPNSVALIPVIAMLLITTAEAPVLVITSACAPLVVPTSCVKLRLPGERVSVSGSGRIETV